MKTDARLIVAALAACAASLGGAACGKKGPPLPPFVRIPAAVTTITVDRAGDDVYVTATLPERNIDGSLPASTTRVDIWAYTGRNAPARARWVEDGTLIGSVSLVPEDPDDAVDAAAAPAAAPAPEAAPPKRVAIHERLTPQTMTTAATDTGADGAAALRVRRFYVAIPVGAKGRPGPLGTVADLELAPRPAPPAGLTVSYDAARITLSWAVPAEGDAWIAGRQAAARASGTVLIPDAMPWRYNVYRTGPPAEPAAPAASPIAGTARPLPANPAPLTATRFTLPVTFDVRTCITVRALFTGDGQPIEGHAAPEVCLTPVDTFPPAAPRQLAALPSGDAIDLIWEANDEPDLAGYHVLRGDAPDAQLRQLTTTPLTETRFRDTSVKQGVKYFYAVVAIDNRTPAPNVSAESNRVQEEPR
jgi:predicted small lipoprotein YifL